MFSVCFGACLSVSLPVQAITITYESLHIETSFLVSTYIFTIYLGQV